MTEQSPRYDAGQAITIEAFKNRPCSLPIDDTSYIAPTPEDIRTLRKLMGLSQAGLAKLVGVSWNDKGSTPVRKWETKKESKEYREISYSSWRLMLIGAGVVDGDSVYSKAQEISR